MSKPNDDVILFKSIYFMCESEVAVVVNIDCHSKLQIRFNKVFCSITNVNNFY